MEIAWDAVRGGLLIGLAALAMMALLGRIAGVSGILGQLLEQPRSLSWPLFFIAGLMLSAWLWAALIGDWVAVVVLPDLPLWGFAVAGLLVGYGTRMGAGCTSGHGVCGIGRLSTRSITATLIFMGVAVATVTIMGVVRGEL